MLGFVPAVVRGPSNTASQPRVAQAWPRSRHITAEVQVTGKLGPRRAAAHSRVLKSRGFNPMPAESHQKIRAQQRHVHLCLQHSARPVVRACRVPQAHQPLHPREEHRTWEEQEPCGGQAWQGLQRAPLRQPCRCLHQTSPPRRGSARLRPGGNGHGYSERSISAGLRSLRSWGTLRG